MSFQSFNKQILSAANLSDPANVLRVINTLQNNIQNSINPMVSKIQNDSTQLISVSLLAGQNNIINHTLNRILNGWSIVRMRSVAAKIYDTQDNNPSPNLTLWLTPDVNVTVDILVY
jgi:hypothetical protein